jgi:DNA-binding NtrC family response regulator
VKGFSDEARTALLQYPWPGNIRELRNAVERGLALARTAWTTPADLPPAMQRASIGAGKTKRPETSGASRAEALDSAERDYLIAMLRENTGNVARTARQAGMSRQGLHKLLKKHGIIARDFRE